MDEDERDRRTLIVDAWIKDRMPGGENVNMDVFKLFKMCLASFIFNRPWFEENMHPENAVRSSPFWSEPIPYAGNVVTRFPWTRTRDTPEFTGLPPDVLYLSKVETLKLEIAELKAVLREFKEEVLGDKSRVADDIVARLNNSLDKREVGRSGYGLCQELDRKLDELLKLGNTPRESTLQPPDLAFASEEGNEELTEYNTVHVEEEDETVEITFEDGTTEAMKERRICKETQQQMRRRKLTVGYHHGKLNPLPPRWNYPKMNIVQLIHMWLMGSLADGVAALRYLDSLQVGHFDKEGQKLSRMWRVIRVVQHFACRRGVWKPNNAKDF